MKVWRDRKKENEELRTQMGKAAREKAVKDFDWRVIAKKIQEVYKKVSEFQFGT